MWKKSKVRDQTTTDFVIVVVVYAAAAMQSKDKINSCCTMHIEFEVIYRNETDVKSCALGNKYTI